MSWSRVLIGGDRIHYFREERGGTQVTYNFDSTTRKQLQERHDALLSGEAGGDPVNTKKLEDYLRKHGFRAKFELLVYVCGAAENTYGAIFAVENLVRKGLVEWTVSMGEQGKFEWSVIPHALNDATEALTDPYPCTLPLDEDDRIYMSANPYRIAEIDEAGKIVGIISLTGSRYGAAPMPMDMMGWIPSGIFVVQRMVGKDLWLSCDVITADHGRIIAVRDLVAERSLQQVQHRPVPTGPEIG